MCEISVVIPAYNAARFLPRAIASVLSQTHQPGEIIVVDDGSADDTRSVVAAYAPRVTYVWRKNGGVSAARNCAVERASGKWIAFLDADDAWRTDKLKRQMQGLQLQPGAVLSYSDYMVVSADGSSRGVAACRPQELLPTVRYRCPFPPSVAVVERKAFLAAGGFAENLLGGEDWDFWVRLVLAYSPRAFVHVAEPLTYYNVVPDSLSQQTRYQFEQYLGLVEHRLLDGLSGIPRVICRRKILARLYRDAAVAFRQQNAPDHFRYMWRSLLAWPIPSDSIQSDRYRIAANMAVKGLKNRLAIALYPLARFCVRALPAPHKGQVWKAIRQHISWRSSERVIKTDQGFVVQGDVAEYIHSCLYLFGIWEQCITRFVTERLKPGDCFIDIGANIGYYSLLSASLVGKTGRVLAVEASPRTYADLVRNLQLNGVTNVRAVNFAASESPGELDLFEAPEDSRGVTTTSATWAKQTHCKFAGKVQSLPMKMMVNKEELRTARVIKIDVEGAEWDVCKGLMPVLPELRSDAEIILEVTPSEIESQGHQCSELIRGFTEIGFFPYVIDNAYSAEFLMEPLQDNPPRRLREFRLTEQTDLVFSRIDANHL
jgi:FkbM family methyltransferase